MSSFNQKITLKENQSIKRKITSEVKLQLPLLHARLIRKFNGKNNFVNSFICIPDIVLGGDVDDIKLLNFNLQKIIDFMVDENIKYNLVGFAFNKSMLLKFEYLVEDIQTGWCSTAWLLEDAEGWKVTKMDAYHNLYG